jgi:hypothetical protein
LAKIELRQKQISYHIETAGSGSRANSGSNATLFPKSIRSGSGNDSSIYDIDVFDYHYN